MFVAGFSTIPSFELACLSLAVPTLVVGVVRRRTSWLMRITGIAGVLFGVYGIAVDLSVLKLI